MKTHNALQLHIFYFQIQIYTTTLDCAFSQLNLVPEGEAIIMLSHFGFLFEPNEKLVKYFTKLNAEDKKAAGAFNQKLQVHESLTDFDKFRIEKLKAELQRLSAKFKVKVSKRASGICEIRIKHASSSVLA